MITPHQRMNALSPYALADLSVPEGKRIIQLSQNESAYPPSPHALKAAHDSLTDVALYPDPDFADLRTEIARVHDLKMDQILCGCGSMDLINLLTQSYLETTDRVICTNYSYIFFRTCAKMAESAIDVVEEVNFTVDVDRMLAAVTPKTKIVFLANPGNPTGTLLPFSEVKRLHDALPDHCMLILDEAYGEFADQETFAGGFDLVAEGKTVVLRTLSKIYGLASARVGWGYFPPDILQNLRKIQHPNSVSSVSQAAARAAMQDQDYIIETRKKVDQVRAQFMTALDTLKIGYVPSHTNFLLIFPGGVEMTRDCVAYLKAEGVLTRAMGGYELPHAIRVTLGREEDMGEVISHLQSWIKTQKQ